MKILFTSLFLLYSFNCFSWFLTHNESNRQLTCPSKYIPIISDFKKHFKIPLGGTTGSEFIFDTITTNFVEPGKYNGGKQKYYMHCAKLIKSDCHNCDATNSVDANYCVHYIHPQKGNQQGCLARGVIPSY